MATRWEKAYLCLRFEMLGGPLPPVLMEARVFSSAPWTLTIRLNREFYALLLEGSGRSFSEARENVLRGAGGNPWWRHWLRPLLRGEDLEIFDHVAHDVGSPEKEV